MTALPSIQEAAAALEWIMESSPDHRSGFNLVVCAHALGDVAAMRRAFQSLLRVSAHQPVTALLFSVPMLLVLAWQHACQRRCPPASAAERVKQTPALGMLQGSKPGTTR